MVRLLESWVRRYPILSIEDGVAENDTLGWQMLTQSLGEMIRLVPEHRLHRPKQTGAAAIRA
jgi:enolase